MGAICQLFQAAGFILGSQACIVCRDTPTAAATSVTVRPSLITASTARYRCSATLISLIRECQGSAEVGVNHQPKPCKASAEGESQASAEGIQRNQSRLGESNPGPTHYECVALPAELRRHMRHCPTGLHAIANYIEIGRGPSKSSSDAISLKGRAKRVLDSARIHRPGPRQPQQVVLFRGTTWLFKYAWTTLRTQGLWP